MSRLLLPTAFVGGLLLAAAFWLLATTEPQQRSAAALMDAVMWNTEPIGGPFSLIDHDGKPRTDADFRGKLLLITFGFTFCSDVCPIDLQSMAAAVDALGPAGDAVQPIFITVDPEKDRPEQLKSYVTLIHPRLTGLTGSARQVADAMRVYRIYAAKTEPAKLADRNIDHSSFIFLVGADGRYIGFLPPGTPPGRIVEAMRPHLAGSTRQASSHP